ncbi:MAG: MIP/aquaporin family protein [Phycisphaerales bacterium]
MNTFSAELIGTMLLILLGDGVVANVVLKGTKGEKSGWIVITFGWAMGVFIGVFAVANISGAHLNPAVTLSLALAGKFAWAKVPAYIIAQMAGAAIGGFLVWLHYHDHFKATENKNLKLAVFCTGPEFRNAPINFISEVIGTFVLVFAVLHLSAPSVGLGSIDALPVALVVLAIGLSLGGTTGYAINPARDLGPRIIHAILPMPGGKRDSDWKYAWIPVVAPLIGASIAAFAYKSIG